MSANAQLHMPLIFHSYRVTLLCVGSKPTQHKKNVSVNFNKCSHIHSHSNLALPDHLPFMFVCAKMTHEPHTIYIYIISLEFWIACCWHAYNIANDVSCQFAVDNRGAHQASIICLWADIHPSIFFATISARCALHVHRTQPSWTHAKRKKNYKWEGR